jgi:hypothetical protein
MAAVRTGFGRRGIGRTGIERLGALMGLLLILGVPGPVVAASNTDGHRSEGSDLEVVDTAGLVNLS